MSKYHLIEDLERTLLDARKDEPSAAAIASYKNLFWHVHAANESVLMRFSRWVQANLVWDSRQDPLLQGMRSGGSNGYRMRYNAGNTNIELAIESEGRLRRLEGEIYPLRSTSALLGDTGPALITLLHNGQIIAETTSDLDGRFGFSNLAADDYALTLFLNDQSRIEIVAVNVL